MEYNLRVVSEPIPFNQPYYVTPKAAGDSYFISLVEYTPPQIEPLPPRKPQLRPKPSVSLVEVGEKLIDVITEGEDLNVTVMLSEASSTDVTVTLELILSDTNVSTDLFKDKRTFGVDEQVDYTGMFSAAQPTDFTSLESSVIIPAGSLSGVVVFSSVDDTILTGKYKVCKVKIKSVSSSTGGGGSSGYYHYRASLTFVPRTDSVGYDGNLNGNGNDFAGLAAVYDGANTNNNFSYTYDGVTWYPLFSGNFISEILTLANATWDNSGWDAITKGEDIFNRTKVVLVDDPIKVGYSLLPEFTTIINDRIQCKVEKRPDGLIEINYLLRSENANCEIRTDWVDVKNFITNNMGGKFTWLNNNFIQGPFGGTPPPATKEYIINSSLDSGYVLVKDNTPYPKWEGGVEVWVKSNELTHWERLIDSKTESTLTFNFGWEDDGGALTDVSTLVSHQVDDIPVYQLKFVGKDIPTDIENATPIDLSGVLPRYRIVMKVGSRA